MILRLNIALASSSSFSTLFPFSAISLPYSAVVYSLVYYFLQYGQFYNNKISTLCFLNQLIKQVPWKICLQYPIRTWSV